jgi:23S rRNA pseudoU1915 N3-methylase RlmH
VYFNLAGAALTSLAVSGARVAAGLSGINTDLLQESMVNVAVDVVGLAVVGLLFQRDLQAQESRLKRASKGAELAKLSVRASKRLIADSDLMESRGIRGPAGTSERFTVNLSSLRRGRGIEKRVVIVVGGSECIAKALEEASRLQEELSLSDLLVVPVVLPAGVAPEVASTDDLPDCVALPVGVAWSGVVKDEAEEARKQDVDVNRDGFCVILKKNGKVGQRTKGIFLSRMVGEVESRKGKGYDVANI